MNSVTKRMLLTPFSILYKISPEADLKLLFFIKQRYPLNLKNPRTYNEKIQWIKLHDRNPLMPLCSDKYHVRQFIKDKGCEEILNKLIWQGFNPNNIPFKSLPSKCVIKATHGSTFNIICQDTSKLDHNETIKTCKKWLKEKYIPCYGEWFYGIEKPRIVIEEFIESADDIQLRDYKVFCFDGIPRVIRIDTDRYSNHKMDLYDCSWNRIKSVSMGCPNSNKEIEKPGCLAELLNYSQILSQPFKHARIDFYIVKDKIYFGEITFTNGSGFDRFSSYEFDLSMGGYINVP